MGFKGGMGTGQRDCFCSSGEHRRKETIGWRMRSRLVTIISVRLLCLFPLLSVPILVGFVMHIRVCILSFLIDACLSSVQEGDDELLRDLFGPLTADGVAIVANLVTHKQKLSVSDIVSRITRAIMKHD